MAIARSTGAFIGTNTSTGDTIANNATDGGNGNVDLLGDNASTGEVEIYVCFTGAGSTGTLDITIIPGWEATSGTPPAIEFARLAKQYQISATSGTQKFYLCRLPASRFMAVQALNNGTGGNLTNVSVLYALTKYS